MDAWQFLQLKATINKLLWFMAQTIVLVFCFVYVDRIYYLNILPDKLVDETYGVTNCTITAKQLTTKGHLIHKYRADFMVNYVANGVQYQSVASGNGLDRTMTSNQMSQQEILSQFDMGSTYPCWYNPVTPQIIVLVQRHSWTSTFPLVVPTLVGVVMVFYMLKTLFMILEAWRHRVVEKRRNKENS